jgi:hypothetical protein
MTRIEYRKVHKLETPAAGEIQPTFGEEIAGRRAAVATYLYDRRFFNSNNPYWSLMSRVEEAGFMPEYVWAYLYRKEWPKSEKPQRLPAFYAWRASILMFRNHKAETHGSLTGSAR